MPQLDFPSNPVSGTTYVAPNGVTYTFNTSIGTGVWGAATSSALTVSAGSISGTASVGSTLTYTPGTASGGTSPYTYAYQWKANGTNIGGATGLTYVVAAGNAGQSLTVTITATDAALPTPATASATTAPTVIPTALTVTAGSISGTATVGSTLTYTPGVASGGTSPYTYAYQWKANSVNIVGATSLTYVPVTGDIGDTLTVTITATDSASQTANATTAPTAAVAASTIPPATYSPSPSTGPAASNTVSTGIWNGTADTLSSTGCIEFTVSPSTTFGQGPTAVNNGDTVSMRWKTGGSCTGAADGTAITGGLDVASGGTNTYNFTVDTTPTNFSFTDLSSQAISTAVTSASITLAGPNVTTYLTTTGGTLTTIQASINGGAFTAIPASGTTMPVEPNQTIQIRGTTGASTSTGYTAILGLGGATTTWTATTTAAVATITTPSISSPANGATNLNPATNSPAGIPLVGSAYSAQNGAGATQTSSTWEVYKANVINPETSAITNAVNTAAGPFTNVYVNPDGSTAYPTVTTSGVITAPSGGGAPRYSSNGTTWNTVAGWPALTGSFFSATNGTTVVVAGGGGNYMTTSNGWTSVTGPSTLPGVSSANCKGLVYDSVNAKFIATYNDVGVSPNTAYSSNGTSWTSVSIGTTYGPIESTLTTLGGKSIFVGFASVANIRIFTSTDGGVNWTANTFTLAGGDIYLQYITAGNGVFLGIGSSTGNVYSSTNGITWAVTGANFTVGTSLWYSPTQGIFWSATGSYSSDGVTWTSAATGWTIGPTYPVTTSYGSYSFGRLAAASGANIYSGIPFSSATLTLTNNTNLSNMVVGDSVVEVGGGADASGTISAIGATSLTLAPSAGTWTNGATVKDTSRTITAPTPTLEPPGANYTAITGSPFTVSASPFTTLTAPQAALDVSSTYYARVKYATTNATAATSSFSGWSSFATASSFVPSPGSALNGGYFGGQINDGGIIYNLIVGPAATAQNGGSSPTGLAYKTTNSASLPAVTYQNQVYGFPANQLDFTSAYPAFQFARGLSISGYNDWYIPAKNELEILYYNLKPNTTSNDTGSGINPNAVPARASNYTAGSPAQTTVALFQTSGAQAFATNSNYWSSTESSSNTTLAWPQSFNDGFQSPPNKTNGYYARAIRREYANAPAIGSALGGGYFAGQYVDGGTTYNLIVAPRGTGESTSVAYKNVNSADPNPALAQNAVYGEIAQGNALAQGSPVGTYPAFEFAGPLSIGGFSDWYIPAQNELAILFNNLGPSFTTATAFKTGNSEAFSSTQPYWSSTEDSSATNLASTVTFIGGYQSGFGKNNGYYARAVRRVAV